MFDPGTRVHVVGVGGAGMSGLARLLSERGCVVSGSDGRDSPTLDELAASGLAVSVGHDARNTLGAQVVLWSPAVGLDNVELRAARRRGAELVTRARALAELARLRPVIGLTGTHGKTTATSMMVHVVVAAGGDPAWLLGAAVRGVGANGHWGSGSLIIEVDESFGTFREIAPASLGLLNVEADHLDYYTDRGELDQAFVDLVGRTTGPVVAWTDDAGGRRVTRRVERPTTAVGRSDADWIVGDEAMARRTARFTLVGGDVRLEIQLAVTGAHNVANAAVVAVLALELGLAPEAVVRGLATFQGAPRRFEFRGRWRGVDVYEDYAHLPGEVAATLAATKAAGYQHVTAVFQPHRVTRTIALADEFATAFEHAEVVVVTDLYSAGEPNPTGVTGELVADAVARVKVGSVRYAPTFNDVIANLPEPTRTDVIVLLGAGDVGSVADMLPGGLDR